MLTTLLLMLLMVPLTSQCTHRVFECVCEATGGRSLRIRRRCMNGETADEQRHQNHKHNGHEQHRPPIHRDPVDNSHQGFLREEQILEAGEWTFSIHTTTPEKHITVTLEVVARRPGCHIDASAVTHAQSTAAQTRGGVVANLTRHLAQFGSVLNVGRRQKTLAHTVFQTDGALTHAVNTHLRSLIALCHVVAVLR